ncbi:hypothetical protein [Brevundimonas sp.]|uniref:hypothetical protein n=1 Tax=Brevundimonas sp. TaxID=1871086 RepID=UPI00289BE672|nr:hypothetical protein [Brevundimonas sp.]
MTDTKLVPVEPTPEMAVAGAAAARDFYSENGPHPRAKAVWNAMLAAAPVVDEVFGYAYAVPNDTHVLLPNAKLGGLAGRPLYAHPDPKLAVAVKALEEIAGCESIRFNDEIASEALAHIKGANQ